jgi:hypothetical protein
MHKYIDFNKLCDFSDTDYLYYDVIMDKLKSYKFKNIVEDDSVYEELALILLLDYEHKIANFTSYAEEGMDLRMFMELRKSVILPFRKDEGFILGHRKLDTPEQVKAWRVKCLNPKFLEYEDMDWQLFFIVFYSTHGKYSEDFEFDFDARGFLLDTPNGYEPQDYTVELLRKFTHYDALGRPVDNPVDLRALAEENNGRPYFATHEDIAKLY